MADLDTATVLARAEAAIANASSDAEAAAITKYILAETRRLRSIQMHGGELPPTPFAQALELDPRYTARAHLTYLSDRIAQAVKDVEQGRSRYLRVMMPPRMGKSTLITKYTPVWVLRKHPDWDVVLASHEGNFATSWGREIRRIIEGDPGLGVTLAPDAGAASEWETTAGGGVLARGVRGSLTGRGAKFLILDDVVKDFVDAHSEKGRQALWDWWLTVAQTRLEQPFLVIAVATRWHEDDFLGRLGSKEYEGDPDDWETIRLPAVADSEDDILGRVPGEPLLSPLSDESIEEALTRWAKTKDSVGTYAWCTPAEAPVTMADWTTKPISQVMPGDLVMGYERGTSDSRLRLVPTVVQEVGVRQAPVQEMRLESGALVRCTEQHRWYTGRNPETPERTRSGKLHVRPMYAPASVGTRLWRFTPELPELTPERQRDLDWMAGIIDGEGNFTNSTIRISQSPTANPDVFTAISECVTRLGWGFSVVQEEADPKYPRWGDRGVFTLHDGRAVIHELLQRTHLAKRERAVMQLWRQGAKKPTRYRDRVESITPGAEENVYALQTGTGNYVVWGYASSNSAMYQQRPSPAKGAIFDSGWWRFWTSDPSKATEDGKVVYLDRDGLAADKRARVIESWDMAFKGTDGSDYVVGGWWAKLGVRRYLLDQTRARRTFTQTLTDMLTWAEDHPTVYERLVEDKANGTAVIDTLKEKVEGLIPVNPTDSKEARARAVTPECEAGNVYLPHPTDPGMEWVKDLLAELRDFPQSIHDDQVDQLTQALFRLRDPRQGSVSVPGTARGQNPLVRQLTTRTITSNRNQQRRR